MSRRQREYLTLSSILNCHSFVAFDEKTNRIKEPSIFIDVTELVVFKYSIGNSHPKWNVLMEILIHLSWLNNFFAILRHNNLLCGIRLIRIIRILRNIYIILSFKYYVKLYIFISFQHLSLFSSPSLVDVSKFGLSIID